MANDRAHASSVILAYATMQYQLVSRRPLAAFPHALPSPAVIVQTARHLISRCTHRMRIVDTGNYSAYEKVPCIAAGMHAMSHYGADFEKIQSLIEFDAANDLSYVTPDVRMPAPRRAAELINRVAQASFEAKVAKLAEITEFMKIAEAVTDVDLKREHSDADSWAKDMIGLTTALRVSPITREVEAVLTRLYKFRNRIEVLLAAPVIYSSPVLPMDDDLPVFGSRRRAAVPAGAAVAYCHG